MADNLPATGFFSTANEGFTTTLESTILSAATTIPLTTASGLTNGTIFVGIIEPGLTNQQVFTGTVDTSGVQITGVTWVRGSNISHTAGVTIVDYVTGAHHNLATTGLLVSHNQDGTMVTSLPLTTPKITTGIKDVNGNAIIDFTATTSAVNQITVADAATNHNPTIQATGSDGNIGLDLKGKGTGNLTSNGTALFGGQNHIMSGCVWTPDSAGATLNASMTSGVVQIGGNPLTVAAITAHGFTASKDTYVDFHDNGDGTASVTYTAVTNNAASPALANSGTTANTVRNAIITSGASSIANQAAINQGSFGALLPIASSVSYAVTDSIGNIIYPNTRYPTIIGYRTDPNSYSPGGSSQVITGCTVPVIVPAGRRIKITAQWIGGQSSASTNAVTQATIKEGSTQLGFAGQGFVNGGAASSNSSSPIGYAFENPSAGLHTYTLTASILTGNLAVSPGSMIWVELV